MVKNGRMYGIKLLGLGSGRLLPEPKWVVSFDPNIHKKGKPYPTGWVESSVDPLKAKRFKTQVEAWGLWNTQSESVPLRPDGKPNKPMTAYTIEITKLPEGGESNESS